MEGNRGDIVGFCNECPDVTTFDDGYYIYHKMSPMRYPTYMRETGIPNVIYCRGPLHCGHEGWGICSLNNEEFRQYYDDHPVQRGQTLRAKKD